MIVGFTGTRYGMTDAQAVVLRGLLPKMTAFHHGSCQGADVQAAQLVASKFRVPPMIISHPGPKGDTHQAESGVDSEVLPGKTHFARNRDIVNACDQLFACPCDMTEQVRGGTWYTINYARKSGKPVVIVYPDGSIGH